MRKILLTLVLGCMATAAVAQQNDPVIFEVGGKQFHQSEFKKDFLKSIGRNLEASPTACTYEKRQALEEYLQLYVNFQAKLIDAYAMGFDTMPSLRKELATYRKELAAPYLIDSATMMNLLHEAYERNHYAVHAAHILVYTKSSATPEDTLKAYNEAMEVYRRATSGEDFFQIAREVAMEQQKTNKKQSPRPIGEFEGDLGCFTVFDMVYPFENAAYNTAVGEISKPVRSRYGYHVVKVFSRVPYYGKVALQHIWIRDNMDSVRAQERINAAYDRLQKGESFETVVRLFSDDQNTIDRGGQLPELSLNQMPPDYVVEIAKGMKEGTYSKPFHTRHGWHIIKLNKQEQIPAFDDMMAYYKQRMARDIRSNEPKSIYVERAKARYNFVDYTKMYEKDRKGRDIKSNPKASLAEVVSRMHDTIFMGQWNIDETTLTDLRPLFAIDGKEYNAIEWVRYIKTHLKSQPTKDCQLFAEQQYQNYINSEVDAYADSRLETDNEEFRDLIKEYRNGLMIFAYNDQMVWSKSILDSTGFAAFYQRESVKHNINDTADAPYFWDNRAKVIEVSIADENLLSKEKALKVIQKSVKKSASVSEMREALVASVKKQHRDSAQITLTVELVERDKQEMLNDNEWHQGIYLRNEVKGYRYLVVEQVLEPSLKSQQEARGYYLNDYQNELEKQLIESLRKKYNVKIYQDVVDQTTY